MPNQVSFTIADLPVTLRWGCPGRMAKLPPAYTPFSASDERDISLDLRAAADPPEEGPPLFDSAPIWSLHRTKGGASFRLFDAYPDLKRTLFIPDDGASAHLCFHAADRNPFVGPALELLMITHLARRNGVILHGCGISIDGRGILFAGESGAGKSTLSRLWAQKKGIEILSDDRVVVRRQGGAFYLYGTPWHGDEAFAAPGGVELSRIFFIRHGQDNDSRKLSTAGAVREMLKCSFPPLWDAGGAAAALELFHAVAVSVACVELAFVPDRTAVDFALALSEQTNSTKP
jgi:hypothetical protein